MLVKIFPHGRAKGSSARGPVDYLLDNRDHRFETRDVLPELLRGDPEMTKLLIDSVPYTQRYTSGVLSFASEESALLSDELKSKLMDDFEQMVAPGIPCGNISWLWVQHTEHDRVELHWVVPNVELESGKRFAPYFDRADRPRFIAWQKYHNLLHGLADPQDPSRTRAVSVDRWLPQEGKDNAAALNLFLERKCLAGELRSRSDVIRFLEEEAAVKVPRRGKDYITVQYGEGKNERFRLRGTVYHEDYRFENALAADASPTHQPSTGDRNRSLRELRERLDALIGRREIYLRKLSRSPEVAVQRTAEAAPGPDRNGDYPSALVAESAVSHDRSCQPTHGGSSVDLVPNPGSAPSAHEPVERQWQILPNRGRSNVVQMPDGENSGSSSVEDNNGRPATLQTSGVAEYGTEKRNRSAVAELIESIKRGIRGTRAKHLSTIHSLYGVVQRASQCLKESVRAGTSAIEHFDRTIRGSHETLAELERVAQSLTHRIRPGRQPYVRKSTSLQR